MHELEHEEPLFADSLTITGKPMTKRYRLNISQRELSARSGFSQKTCSRIENGLDISDIRTLAKIADVLQCKLRLSFE